MRAKRTDANQMGPLIKVLAFEVPGPPVAKGRARSVIRNGRIGHYTPEKTERYENLVCMAAKLAMQGRSPVTNAVTLRVDAYMPIPASWSKKKRDRARSIEHITRPDLDNIIKAIKDGCNQVVWRDDSQVTAIEARKFYSVTPRVEVECIWVDEGETK
jgi:Holliday junction resolvase RusA-like endonuclease